MLVLALFLWSCAAPRAIRETSRNQISAHQEYTKTVQQLQSLIRETTDQYMTEYRAFSGEAAVFMAADQINECFAPEVPPDPASKPDWMERCAREFSRNRVGRLRPAHKAITDFFSDMGNVRKAMSEAELGQLESTLMRAGVDGGTRDRIKDVAGKALELAAHRREAERDRAGAALRELLRRHVADAEERKPYEASIEEFYSALGNPERKVFEFQRRRFVSRMEQVGLAAGAVEQYTDTVTLGSRDAYVRLGQLRMEALKVLNEMHANSPEKTEFMNGWRSYVELRKSPDRLLEQVEGWRVYMRDRTSLAREDTEISLLQFQDKRDRVLASLETYRQELAVEGKALVLVDEWFQLQEDLRAAVKKLAQDLAKIGGGVGKIGASLAKFAL
jgi:hypothetical protein